MKSQGIKVAEHVGTWEVVQKVKRHDKDLYLLEHEIYGGLTACIIVDGECNLIIDNCHNEFMDYDEIVEEAKFLSDNERIEYLRDNFKSEKYILHLIDYFNKY